MIRFLSCHNMCSIMDKDYMKQLISILSGIYGNFRYEDSPDWLSAESTEHLAGNEIKPVLEDFFIDMSFDCYELWMELDLVAQDLLHRSMESFRRISEVKIREDVGLICFKYRFLTDLDELYDAYQFLDNNDEDAFIKKYPSITERSLNAEIDYIRLLLYYLKTMYQINYEDLPIEVRT